MTKFGSTSRAPVLGTTGEKIATHEGGTGYVREPKAELYITAISSLMENTFYETADARELRLAGLVKQVALTDPEWMLHFVKWLRTGANLRSVAVLIACQAVKARLDDKAVDEDHRSINRQLIAAASLRADEPGELISYWQSRYGRNLPMPVKRGIADAASAAFSERSALRYDGGATAMRLGDVVELVHPSPRDDRQSALFGWLLDRRHGRRETPVEDLALLPAVTARTRLNGLPVAERHAFARRVLNLEPDAEAEWVYALAGQWEWAKSWLGQDSEDTTFDRIPEADQWQLFIHHGMGYMAMLRNLRNFDEAKISTDVRKHVEAVLASEEEVRHSRQFPFRFYSAYKATGGGSWAKSLSAGLQHSLANVPSLDGNTLFLVDMSGSMFGRISARSEVTNAEQAALFGSALALRAEQADLVQFGTGSAPVAIDKGSSVLAHMAKFSSMGGTQTMQAVRERLRSDHTRLVIVTDEQAHYDRLGGSLDSLVPDDVQVFTWNVGGYKAAHAETSPTRHALGGLSDQSWGTIPLIEAGTEQKWPWES